MGHGVWNPSLLEDDSRALHVAYAKAEDESDEDEADFVRQCDEEDMLAAADSIAAAFDIEVDEREGWYKSHGDRYQLLVTTVFAKIGGKGYVSYIAACK